jgi:fructose-bisphosphate aldolase class I
MSQQAGLLPIVEPEVLMDGDHTIERCAAVTLATLRCVFNELHEHRVRLDGILLKPNMVLSGKDCPQQAGVDEVATATLACFRQTIPAAVPGIVFLSGGQSAVRATEHLNAMNACGGQSWELSFSYGRALQGPVLEAWQGQSANVPAAQKFFQQRARCNGAARYGKYAEHMEKAA